MTTPRHLMGSFPSEVAQRWQRIPRYTRERILANVYTRERILANVWCGQCLRSVIMALEMAGMVGNNLILRDKCQDRSGNVCRVVEPNPN